MIEQLILGGLKIAVIFGLVMTIVPMLVYAERVISARIQNRYGPIMVGLPNLPILGPLKGFHMFGLMQPLADMLKFMFKEDFVPAAAERPLYRLAPALVLIPAGIGLAGVPFGPVVSWAWLGLDSARLVIFDSQLGVLFVLAATSLGVHGLTIAGWASNNKYSLMGGVRASAQLISYEAPMFMALLAVLAMAGTTSFYGMVNYQINGMWLCVTQPIAFVIFFVCMFAETNRAPFDMPEAEPELVGGYHTEYGGMRFAVFFLGEYIAMFNQCAILSLCFLGGWQALPIEAFGLDTLHTQLGGWMGFFIFFGKVFTLLMIMIWVRWTLPRFRYDQLMQLGWKRLTPLAMANLAVTVILGSLFKQN